MKTTTTFLLSLLFITSVFSQKKLEKVTFEYNCNLSIYKNERGEEYPKKGYFLVKFEDPKQIFSEYTEFDNLPNGTINITSRDVSFGYEIKYLKSEGDSFYYVVVRDPNYTGINVIIITRKKGTIQNVEYDNILQLASFTDRDFKKPLFLENYYLQYKSKRELYSESIKKDSISSTSIKVTNDSTSNINNSIAEKVNKESDVSILSKEELTANLNQYIIATPTYLYYSTNLNGQKILMIKENEKIYSSEKLVTQKKKKKGTLNGIIGGSTLGERDFIKCIYFDSLGKSYNGFALKKDIEIKQ